MSTPDELARFSGAPQITAPAGASPEVLTAAFEADERIHFSTVTRRWTLEDESGAEWEYEPVKAVWVPVVSAKNRCVQCAERGYLV